ncbi:hypothetical protein GOARA_012_01070 [Gordonia araii NBRC 100433]|uniref:Uncharacterized protein n=1 Tax=Gordonia araii NBRC 100433 TaxID=1073574 RepID=G7GY81_9ACTN|nr:hypothetical protein [Gordonia araii]NNG98163.1 hypothetical protein [Gordonia araii NBRC 100433]GAB08556.1 hypothetical protein GOARA_012_01070 [Gordonia araii NBRC 100433]
MSFLFGVTVGSLIGYWTGLTFSGLVIGLMAAAAYVQARTRPDDPELSFWHANTQWKTPFRVLVNVLAVAALVAAFIATRDHSDLVQNSTLGFILVSYWALIYAWWRLDVQKRAPEHPVGS